MAKQHVAGKPDRMSSSFKRITTVPIPAWHREILEERLADLATSPRAGRSWDAVLARVKRP